MCYSFAVRLALAFALCLAAGRSSYATDAKERPATSPQVGFPGTSRYEKVLVGKGATPSSVRSRGRWQVDAQGVHLLQPHAFGDSYWFPKIEEPLADGSVRADVVFGGAVDTSLMFRCQLPDGDIEALSGYGLSVYAGGLGFYRWEDGYSRPMGASVRIAGLLERSGIEIVLTMIGPQITAQVFDLKTLAPLATLTVTGERFMHGSVGLRAHGEQGNGTRLTLLSVLPASAERLGDPNSLTGTRIVHLSTAFASRLSPRLAATIVAHEGNELVLRTSPLELELLRRTGIELGAISDAVPWKYVDGEYLHASRQQGEPPRYVYKNAVMVEATLRQLQRSYPELTQLQSIGKTASGRDIWALKISARAHTDEIEPAILLDGAHHGAELWTTEYVLDAAAVMLAQYQYGGPARRWLDALEIWCVPLVNPDGRDAFMEVSQLAGRKNYRDVDGDGVLSLREGVDLNRNYPFGWGGLGELGSRSRLRDPRFRGPAAASEAETRAMMQLAKREKFVAALSVHTAGTTILPPYAALGLRAPRGDEAWGVAQELARRTPRQANGKRYRLRHRLYPVDGVWKDWLRHEIGTVAMVVEGPYHNPTDPVVRELSITQSRPIWMTLFERFVAGPHVTGVIKNEEGEPLEALVSVEQIVPQEGEQWTSRARDGLFARFLPHAGRYKLQLAADGYRPMELAVQTGVAAQPLTVMMAHR